MRIMLLNAAIRLFRTQLTNVPISFMDLIGHDIFYIVLQESFKFPAFVDSIEDPDLCVQFGKLRAILPIMKENFH